MLETPWKNSPMTSLNDIVYCGEYEHTLDPQRRIAIPSAWRDKSASDSWYLVPGRDGLLQMIPIEVFSEFVEKARKVSFANHKAQIMLARFSASIQECKGCKNGRIQISQKMLDHAGIKNDVVLVGCLTMVQLWSPDRWKKVCEEATDADLDTIQSIGETPTDPMSAIMEMIQNGGSKE